MGCAQALCRILAIDMLASAWGCGSERCEIDNDQLAMVARAVDFGSSVRVAASFREAGVANVPVPWEVCDGDSIRINDQDTERVERGERIEYVRSFTAEQAPAVFTVELERALAEDPVVATVERAPEFEILEPRDGAVLRRSEAVRLRWTPENPGQDMQVELREEIGGGRCITTELEEHDYKGPGGVRIDDDGGWMIPAGVLGNAGVDVCRAIYELRRFSAGEYPSQFAEGGFVEAEVVRFVAFESVP